jgi:hypothetical protein
LGGVSHVERYRDNSVVAKGFHRCVEIVDQQIAGRDTESALVQPLHDSRALAARGTGHQRDPIATH